jgi:hypothetical protein
MSKDDAGRSQHQPMGTVSLLSAVLAGDPNGLSQRIQEAQDEIIDEMEDSVLTASSIKRQQLIDAMNTVLELNRISRNPRWNRNDKSNPLRDAA